MNEEQIRQIVRDEIEKNFQSGDPKTPRHVHDGVSNSVISLQTLGLTPVPQSNTKIQFRYLTNQNGVNSENTQPIAYGFSSPSILSPATSGHLQQYTTNPNVYINPIPIVVGNGVGIQGAFNGGAAPDGTMVAFITGSATTSFLYIRFDGSWYGVNLAASPITP